jgi:hypothetical protein
MQIRESVYEKIQRLLEQSCTISMDRLRYDDDSPVMFEHILEKDRFWLCAACRTKIGNE